jgi:type 1 glutamine amidotransferase
MKARSALQFFLAVKWISLHQNLSSRKWQLNAENSYDKCHPLISNCNLDIKIMNTSYYLASSPNNVHFVSCNDYHGDLFSKNKMIGIFHYIKKPDSCVCSSLVAGLIFLLCFSSCSIIGENENLTVKGLILSGQNNHEWEKTTATLTKMYKQLPRFEIDVNLDPESLTYEEMKKYDVLISNWNNWPENDIEWDVVQEKAFSDYVQEGGGMVFIHAGASSYYSSEVYHNLGIGRWGDETSHGLPVKVKVVNISTEHPITRGLKEFYIYDEVWENTDISPAAAVLARLTGTAEEDGHDLLEEAVLVKEIGKGRTFYTILGHDDRALSNTGLKTLLLRATEWAATGEVTQEIPQDLQLQSPSTRVDNTWTQTDTTLQLFNGDKLVWQYNFRNRFGKPYLHPVYLNNTRLTSESPTDHVWHYGLWFSWKFINGLNYWEYLDDFKTEETGYKSQGITEINTIDIRQNPDFSADIDLDIIYHPGNEDPVLRESRKIYISPQDNFGQFYIDYVHHFIAEYVDVMIDRTPILGEPEGKSWGGYGGLSIRFNQDFTETETIPSVNYPDFPVNDWFYMGFNSLTGEKAGLAMFQHPDYTTETTRWYYLTDKNHPFFFFSPAALYDGNYQLNKGESLILKYRVWILSEASDEILAEKFHHYIYK